MPIETHIFQVLKTFMNSIFQDFPVHQRCGPAGKWARDKICFGCRWAASKSIIIIMWNIVIFSSSSSKSSSSSMSTLPRAHHHQQHNQQHQHQQKLQLKIDHLSSFEGCYIIPWLSEYLLPHLPYSTFSKIISTEIVHSFVTFLTCLCSWQEKDAVAKN